MSNLNLTREQSVMIQIGTEALKCKHETVTDLMRIVHCFAEGMQALCDPEFARKRVEEIRRNGLFGEEPKWSSPPFGAGPWTQDKSP